MTAPTLDRTSGEWHWSGSIDGGATELERMERPIHPAPKPEPRQNSIGMIWISDDDTPEYRQSAIPANHRYHLYHRPPEHGVYVVDMWLIEPDRWFATGLEAGPVARRLNYPGKRIPDAAVIAPELADALKAVAS